MALTPGTYGDVRLNAGASMSFVEGVYNFRSFVVEAGNATLHFDPDGGFIELNAQNELRFGDRNSFVLAGDADPSVRYTIPQITSVWRNVPDDTIPAWCINRSTPGSEPDWTCKDLEWIYVSPTWKVITVGTYNGPQRTGVPEEIRKATKRLVGKPFSKLREMAMMQNRTNPEKGRYFAELGRELKVDYDFPRHP